MATAVATAPPAPSLAARLITPRTVLILLLLMWVPLTLHVMFGHALGAARNLVLLPAIPATVVLYVVAITAWRESTVAVIGASLVFFWVFIAVTAPFLPLIDPNKPIAPFTPPLTEKADLFFWLGTDFKGRDMLSRTLWGCQRVIVWGVTATLVAYIVGTMFGLLAGYLSGWWDEIISFFANVLLSFPVMVLFIVILNYLGPSGFNIVIAVTFASAPAIMRIVRGLTLDIKTRDYVFAAQTFLGLGLQPPDPDGGLMIKEAAKTAMLFKFSYMLIIPALSVSSLILGFNLLADGLREISLRD